MSIQLLSKRDAFAPQLIKFLHFLVLVLMSRALSREIACITELSKARDSWARAAKRADWAEPTSACLALILVACMVA